MTTLHALFLLAGGLALLLAGVEEAAESFRSAGPGLRARLLSNCRQERHLCYAWDGQRINSVYEKRALGDGAG